MSRKRSATPLDEEARRRARRELDRTLLLEAGAGTGKTTLLVDRIANLVGERGVAIERIVAITFTEKAAAEMMLRLRQELEQRAADETAAQRKSRYDQALSDLPLANVSTIHAFAAALLRERPVEAGVDPGFEVMDAVETEMMIDEVWRRWEERQLMKRAASYAKVLMLGVQRARVAEIAREMLWNRDVVTEDAFACGDIDRERELAEIVELAESLESFARERCSRPDDKLFIKVCDAARQIRDLAAAEPSEIESILLGGFSLAKSSNSGSRVVWGREGKEEAIERYDLMRGRLEALERGLGARVAADLAGWLQGFFAEYAEEKERRGKLDFHDLLESSRALLRDDLVVRADFQNHFDAILIDEFQDTDPLQAQIILFLAADGTDARDWRDVRVAPGKLFVVGDPKQSIYRFRRADIEIYKTVRRMVCDDEPVPITQNFRSVPGVVNWVNALFRRLFSPEVFDLAPFQAPFTEILPYWGAKPNRPPVVLLAPPADAPSGLTADEVREVEAEAIAEAIVAGSDAGWIGSPSDVAILFRSMTHLALYEEALTARDIPFQVEGGKSFFVRSEVQALLSALSAIDDPENQIALVAALRSPLFGVSDDELALYASETGRFRYLDGSPDRVAHASLHDAFEILRGLHERRGERSLHRLVEDIFDATRLLEFHALRGGGARAVSNLRRVADKARAFERKRANTARAFVRWLRDEEAKAEEGDSPIAERQDELVSLLTIHTAKGLEFPVVILANLATWRPSNEKLLVDAQTGAISFTLGRNAAAVRSEGHEEMHAREELRLLAEERRLLYVAATRAQDTLVLPGQAMLMSERKRKNCTMFEALRQAFPREDPWRGDGATSGMTVLTVGAAGTEREAPAARRPARKSTAVAALHDESAWCDGRRRALEAGGRALGHLTAHPEVSAYVRGSEERGPRAAASEPSSATEGVVVGKLVHSILEALPGLDPKRLAETAASVCAGDEGEAGRDEAIELCRAVLADPVIERARRAPRLLREVPFTIDLDGQLAEGFIDLLFEEDDELVLVDYKTDRVDRKVKSAVELERFAESRGHITQLSVYSRALRKAILRPVREAVLIYARSRTALSLAASRLDG